MDTRKRAAFLALVQAAESAGALIRAIAPAERWVEGVQALAEQRFHMIRGRSSCGAGCSACCTANAIPVLPGEVERLMPFVSDAAKERARALRGVDQKTADRIPCPLLDTTTRRCSVYEHRPAICRPYSVVSPPENCGTTAEIRMDGEAEVFTIGFARALYQEEKPFRRILWRELSRLADA